MTVRTASTTTLRIRSWTKSRRMTSETVLEGTESTSGGGIKVDRALLAAKGMAQ